MRFLALASAFFIVNVPLPAPLWAAQFTHPTMAYTFSYPDTWNVARSGSAGGVALTNFLPSEYLRSGFLPNGGAEISMGLFPSDTNEVAELNAMAKEDHGREVVASNGAPAEIHYFAPETSESLTCTAPRVAGKLFIACLRYNSRDPLGATYEPVLTNLVNSLSVPASTQVPTAAGSPVTPLPTVR